MSVQYRRINVNEVWILLKMHFQNMLFDSTFSLLFVCWSTRSWHCMMLCKPGISTELVYSCPIPQECMQFHNLKTLHSNMLVPINCEVMYIKSETHTLLNSFLSVLLPFQITYYCTSIYFSLLLERKSAECHCGGVTSAAAGRCLPLVDFLSWWVTVLVLWVPLEFLW